MQVADQFKIWRW